MAGGVLLDMSGMNRILALDEDNLSVTVEPGVLLMELAAYVEERGFFYPPDPGEKSATIGGNISTNAGGMRAVKYGVTRDYVRALEVVLPSGEILTLGGETVKNSSGLSLKDLVVGSEGTLCVITKATLKLLACPRGRCPCWCPSQACARPSKPCPPLCAARPRPRPSSSWSVRSSWTRKTTWASAFPTTAPRPICCCALTATPWPPLEEAYDDVAKLCLERGRPGCTDLRHPGAGRIHLDGPGRFPGGHQGQHHLHGRGGLRGSPQPHP